MAEKLAQLKQNSCGDNLDLTNKTRILNQEVAGSYTYTFSSNYKTAIVLIPTLRFESNQPTCTLSLNSTAVTNILTSDYAPYNTSGDGQGRAIATLAILNNISAGDQLVITCSFRGKAQIYV